MPLAFPGRRAGEFSSRCPGEPRRGRAWRLSRKPAGTAQVTRRNLEAGTSESGAFGQKCCGSPAPAAPRSRASAWSPISEPSASSRIASVAEYAMNSAQTPTTCDAAKASSNSTTTRSAQHPSSRGTRLNEALPEHLRPVVQFALASSCRMSEILHLSGRASISVGAWRGWTQGPRRMARDAASR